MVQLPDVHAPPPSRKIQTDDLVCDFGKHNGTPYTRLPVSYLHWMVAQNHSRADIAQAELDRRGTRTPELDVSGHAVDRASIKCHHIWSQKRRLEEGIHSWLCRVAKEAIDAASEGENVVDDQGRVHHGGMIFVFDSDSEWPVLKTIYPEKGNGAPLGILELIEAKRPAWAKARRAYSTSKGNW